MRVQRASGDPNRNWWRRKFSRRDVLKGFAAGAIGLGAAPVFAAGCGGQSGTQGGTGGSPSGEEIIVTVAANLAFTNDWVAQDAGIFQDHGLNTSIETFDVGFLGTQAVMANEATTSRSVELPFLNLLAQGADLVIPAVVITADDQKLVVSKSITEPENLRSKKIGLISGSAFDYAFQRYLEEFNIPSEEVEIVNVDAAEQVATFTRGAIDGFVNVDPLVSKGLEAVEGAHLLEPNIDAAYTTRNYLQMRRSWAEDNRPRVEEMLRALVDTYSYIQDNRDEAAQIAAERTGVDVEVAKGFFKSANPCWDPYLDDTSVSAMEEVANWMKDQGELDEIPDFRNAIDRSYLQAVASDRVREEYSCQPLS